MSDVTVTVTRSVALALVRIAGDLEPDDRGRYGGLYWQLDEALRVALVALAEAEAPAPAPFAVGLPVEYFWTEADAIAFARERYGADAQGRVQLVRELPAPDEARA
jgi:hypothetical protein